MPAQNTQPTFIGAKKTYVGALSAANTARDGTGTIVDVVTAGTNGTRIGVCKAIATSTTTAGMIRWYLYNGSAYKLWYEQAVTAITPSGTTAVWSGEFATSSVSGAELVLPTGWKLAAAPHNDETFNAIAYDAGDY